MVDYFALQCSGITECYPELSYDFYFGRSTDEFCGFQDQMVVSGMREAAVDLLNEKFSFKYFDLWLSEYEQYLLDRIEVTNFYTLFNPSKLDVLGGELVSFIKSLSSIGRNDIVAPQIATIVTRIVRNVIDASNFEDCSIYLRSDMDIKNYGYAYNISSLDWHIDKTLREIIDPNYIDQRGQLTYIFTLKGRSTIYYQSDLEFHDKFLSAAHNTYLNFGCDMEANCNVADIVDLSDTSFAEFAQASVHIAGRNYGTIHSAPHPHERLVMIIIPEDKAVIDEYSKVINEITQKLLFKI